MRFRILVSATALAIAHWVPIGIAMATEIKSEPTTAATGKAAKASRARLVDINHATKAQLMKLPGIGAPEADRIIAGRPYGSKAQLVTKNILTYPSFDGIRKRIVAG